MSNCNVSNVANVSFIGRPNAGKSTLMNTILKRKLAIVSPKANTTRFSISGVCHEQDFDIAITDTPGLESKPQNEIGRLLVASARGSLMFANVVALIIDGAGPILEQDYALYQEATQNGKHVLVVFTKTDLVSPRSKLLPKIEQIQQWGYKGVVWLVSVKSEKSIEKFKEALREYSTDSESECSVDSKSECTTESESYGVNISKGQFASECTREHAFRLLNQEIPYGLWVSTKWLKEDEIEKDNPNKKVCEVHQTLYVLEERHKPIVLGAKGQMIKRIGSRTRVDLMKIWNQKVRLFITVKVGEESELLKSCRVAF